MAFESVRDSGERTSFATGSVRDKRTGKGRFDLLSPHVLRRDARHMENGATKYGDRNWEKGQPISVFLDSAMRHIVGFMEGLTDEDHLAAARWNIAGIMHVTHEVAAGRLPETLVDLPNVKLEELKRVLGMTEAKPASPPKRRYFVRNLENITHYWWFENEQKRGWEYKEGRTCSSDLTVADVLSGGMQEVPNAPF